jgi:hypothetical protein
MSIAGRIAVVAALAVGCAPGCKRSPPAPTASSDTDRAVGRGSADAAASGSASRTVAPSIPVGPVGPVGVKTPFEPLDRASAKTFAAAQAALRAKKYPAARELFHEVVTAHPDHLAARTQELRSAVLADPAADVRDLWRDLLARDFVGAATRLQAPAELAPLRRSPRWPELETISATVKTAYVQGLDRGLFFLARSRPAKSQLYDDKGRPFLELFQEAYHFDVATGRVRRLTETGGHVFGILPDRPRNRLLLLVVEGLKNNDVDSGMSFLIFKAVLLPFETLEPTAVPFPQGVPVPELSLCVSEKGTPMWTTKAAYTIDTAKKTLVETDEPCPAGTGVKITPDRGSHDRPAAAGVTVDGARKLVTIGGAQKVPRKNRVSESMGWSPAKTQLVLPDEFDLCELQMRFQDRDWPRTARGELALWDAATKKTSRVAEAFSFFEWEWLDDDHLAHETGSKTSPRVAVYQISSRTETVIEMPAGAGLVAVPSLDCPIQTVEDADDGAE